MSTDQEILDFLDENERKPLITPQEALEYYRKALWPPGHPSHGARAWEYAHSLTVDDITYHFDHGPQGDYVIIEDTGEVIWEQQWPNQDRQ